MENRVIRNKFTGIFLFTASGRVSIDESDNDEHFKNRKSIVVSLNRLKFRCSVARHHNHT